MSNDLIKQCAECGQPMKQTQQRFSELMEQAASEIMGWKLKTCNGHFYFWWCPKTKSSQFYKTAWNSTQGQYRRTVSHRVDMLRDKLVEMGFEITERYLKGILVVDISLEGRRLSRFCGEDHTKIRCKAYLEAIKAHTEITNQTERQ